MYYLWAARGSRRGADWDRLGSVPNLEKKNFFNYLILSIHFSTGKVGGGPEP